MAANKVHRKRYSGLFRPTSGKREVGYTNSKVGGGGDGDSSMMLSPGVDSSAVCFKVFGQR